MLESALNRVLCYNITNFHGAMQQSRVTLNVHLEIRLGSYLGKESLAPIAEHLVPL